MLEKTPGSHQISILPAVTSNCPVSKDPPSKYKHHKQLRHKVTNAQVSPTDGFILHLPSDVHLQNVKENQVLF